MCRFILTLSGFMALAPVWGQNTPGWSQLPNTKISTVCACKTGFSTLCSSGGADGRTVFNWSSGVYDTRRDALYVTGGGHNDYYGNEIYKLDLVTKTMTRLTDPGMPTSTSCQEAIANGTQPNSRHTYDGIAYMANVDKMFVFSGSLACGSGNFGVWTWTYDFTAKKWEHVNAGGANLPKGGPGVMTAYDSASGLLFLNDLSYLYSYNPTTHLYTRFDQSYKYGIDYHLSATIDPKRRKFVMVGNGTVYTIDLSGADYSTQTVATTGGSAIVGSAYPGLAYHPGLDRIVAWNGYDDVYSLNLDTKQWTKVTYTGGPGKTAGDAYPTGTYDRWSYSPRLNAIVLVNTNAQDAFIFRFPGTMSKETAVALASTTGIEAFPNPARSFTTVRIPAGMQGGVYDTRGRKIADLTGGSWDARAFAPGIYTVRVATDDGIFSKKITVIK